MEDGRAEPLHFFVDASEVGRLLPERDIDRDTFADAYIQFILFCNPSYADDADVAALKETLSSPPTSNKKTFDVFDIYLLVKKLNDFEIKTWHQLAIDLGVEPSTSEDGAGAQRVQQYVVRLKRWMKVTHVDAFFQYLMGRPHDYFLEVPPVSDPHPAEGRDGVPATEDLALRALDPRLRPKRGRKRLESSMDELPPAQRHTFTNIPADDRRAVFATPSSAFPRSAFPSSAVTDRPSYDPWSTLSVTFPSQLGFPAPEPRSAFSAFAADPRSATVRTPVMPNRLNAWAAASGPRASPTPSHPSPLQHSRPPPRGTSLLSTLNTASIPPPPPPHEAPMSAVSAASTASKRERQRLSLQVPPHTGGPVRLMTPPAPAPPDALSSSEASTPPAVLASEVGVSLVPAPSAATAFAALHRALASDLLRATIVGRVRLSGVEARALAGAVLGKMGAGNGGEAGKVVAAATTYLGLGDKVKELGLGGRAEAVGAGKTLRVARFRVDDEGWEMPVEENEGGGGGGKATGRGGIGRKEGKGEAGETGQIKEVFDLEWGISMGALVGRFEVKGVEIGTLGGE